MSERIQRKRTRGWKMPDNTVYVGRPTEWGNPYVGSGPANRAYVTDLYRTFVNRPEMADFRAKVKAELRGKDLACWCPLDQPCHADVLLELANERTTETQGDEEIRRLKRSLKTHKEISQPIREAAVDAVLKALDEETGAR